jgi:uncharacterized protein YhfF
MMLDSVALMWMAYCSQAGLDTRTAAPPSWHFCDSREDADACAKLVMAGVKRATAPSLWGFAHRGEAVPVVGALDIVTTWEGEACAVIRTTRVAVVPYDEVDAEFAAAEGEGDGSLEYWRRVHWDYYARELDGSMFAPSPRMPVLCQWFEVVYPV